jgi:hypothetical protein
MPYIVIQKQQNKGVGLKNFIIAFAFLLISTKAFAYCPKGIKECRDLRNDRNKYSNCLKLKCDVAYKQAEQCSVGKIRCEKLINKPSYNACINDTCKALKDKKLECIRGKNSCKQKAESFRNCIKSNKCQNQNCNVCKNQNKLYWLCLCDNCLGGLDRYVLEKNYTPISSSNKENVSTKGKQNKSLILDSTLRSKVFCASSKARLFCLSSKFESCICSDGSMPLIRK